MSIRQESQEGVLTLRIERPEKRNALTYTMYRQLSDALAAAENDPQVRVVMITGKDQCFTSGNDIADFLSAIDQGPADNPALAFLCRLAAFPKPLVAAVRGAAVGIGTTLLLHCDLIYASEEARFQLPFVNLGLVPEGGSSVLLPRLLGHARAAELLMLGEPFDAETALELGLINGCLADAEVESHAQTQALKLAAKPPSALAKTKAMLKAESGQLLAPLLETEVTELFKRLGSPEAQEALRAFQEKRAPDFSRFC